MRSKKVGANGERERERRKLNPIAKSVDSEMRILYLGDGFCIVCYRFEGCWALYI